MRLQRLVITITLVLFSALTFSHRGRLSSDGCHYCRSNCEKYGLVPNTRHSHDGRACKNGPSKVKGSSTSKQVSSNYSRKAFKHWIDKDRDCKNTRHELLESRSLSPVKYKVSKSGKRCSVKSGRWNDYYFNEVLTSASDIDIDHIVPLKEAWISGAHSWSPEKRKAFANDTENLAITNKTYNRKKGAQTPLTWSPINREYNCKYLKQWIYIKKKYSLKINPTIFENYKISRCK